MFELWHIITRATAFYPPQAAAVGRVAESPTPHAHPLLYRRLVRIERHWWNGNHSSRGRRDVYIRTDGQLWEVRAQTGGDAGRSKVHPCPSRASAEILAGAWLGGRPGWRELAPDGAPQEHSRHTS